jgi:hypothetical protein
VRDNVLDGHEAVGMYKILPPLTSITEKAA